MFPLPYLFLTGLLLSALLTWLLIRHAIRRQLLDHPNERSSHAVSTPRGGGLAIVLVSVGGVLVYSLAAGLPLDDWSWLLLPALLIEGQVSPEEVKPLGPLGISQMAGDAIERSSEEQSWFTILFFAGAISMALGITNLLPLPALDGGRIVFVLLEAVRGRRIDPAKEGVVHLIGMALLLGLMLFMTIQELINPIQSPF